MEERWRRRVLVPLLGGAVGAGALVTVMLVVAAAGQPGRGTGAPVSAEASPAACTARVGRTPDDPARAAWFTLRSRTERDGALAGYVLRLAVAGRDALAALDVPPESFA